MERDGAQVMEQREKVARAIAKATIGDDVAINREGFSRQHYYEVADAVLAALGLGEGGENVVVPRSAVSKCPFDADDMDMDEPCPVCGVTGHAGLDAVMAKCVGYARPQAGEAGE